MSSGGLDQFLDITPLNVDEGGFTPLVVNLTGVTAFLQQHADIKTPHLAAFVAGAPLRGEVCVLSYKK